MCVVGITGMGLVSAIGADWFQWRGPDRSGVIADEIAGSGSPRLSKVWDTEVGIGCASMVISGDRLITVGHEEGVDTVYCFNAKDGRKLWAHQYPAELLPINYEGGPAATPTIEGGMVYVYSREGRLLALDLNSGELKWQVDVTESLGGEPPRWKYSTSPLVYDGKVIVDVGGPNASTVAFDKNSGDVVWKSGNDKAGYSSPILLPVGGKPRIAMFNEYGLVLFDPSSGAQTGRFRWETSYGVNAATPIVIGDGMVFISSGYGKGSAMLRVSDGSVDEVWANNELQSQFSTPVYSKGVIFGYDTGKKRFKALNARTGEVYWETGDYGKGGTVVMAGSTLVLLEELGELFLTRPTATGLQTLAKVKALRPKSWVAPAIHDDLIYVRNNRGDLACYRVN